jgi:hypothetical protein
MLRPDARQEEREAKRDDQRIMACLLVALLLGIVFTGAAITTSLLWPAQAYPVQWYSGGLWLRWTPALFSGHSRVPPSHILLELFCFQGRSRNPEGWSRNSVVSCFPQAAILVLHRHFLWERVSFHMVSFRA